MTGQLATKFKFLKPDARGGRGGYAKYIATREGVEKIQGASLHAYADYIALRPGAERTGRHGLFTNAGEEVILEKVSKELNDHPGNVWTGIISLRREDAERLGFDSGERWRTLLRSHVCELAEDLKIDLAHLKWYAAFHNEGHHPHVHMIAWSTDPGEGYLSRKGVMQFRSALARDIFAHDLLEIYQQETALRDELRAEGKKQLENLVESVHRDGYVNPEVEQLLLTLAWRLRRAKGKKVYGYLRSDLRDVVNEVVKIIEDDPSIRELYDRPVPATGSRSGSGDRPGAHRQAAAGGSKAVAGDRAEEDGHGDADVSPCAAREALSSRKMASVHTEKRSRTVGPHSQR